MNKNLRQKVPGLNVYHRIGRIHATDSGDPAA